jgi:hypothetical protein
MTVIEVKPRKWGWCVFEAPGVEPVFMEKDQAIGYAEARAAFRKGEIRILDSNGNIERTIAFDETNRKLG